MSGDSLALLGLLSLALILPVAALRREPIGFGRRARMAVIWIALFALVAMGFTWLGM